MIVDCCKRCVTYSLFKSVKICNQTIKYMRNICESEYFSTILMEIKELFDRNEPRYLLNQLYLNDYLIYLFNSRKKVNKELENVRK